ncbi:MAG: phosphodiester glycosidase family protein [Bacilli bacterium]|nr:phosphodiester glycosidase family protein [Bacilli bacterium]
MKKGVIICAILDLLAFTCLFLAYGPISYFRNLLITTAMTTKSHHYLAYTLYSKATIEKVLASNYMIEDSNNSNDDIDFSKSNKTTYDSVYEEQILKKDKGNSLYKIIPLSGSGYKGNMVVIYDSKRISLVSSRYLGTRGETLSALSENNNAIIGMNASGFVDVGGHGSGGAPTGQVIQNGKVVYTGGTTGHGGGLAGFNKDGVLVLTRESASVAISKGLVDAVEFGPFLMINGNASNVVGNGGWGIAPRTVLAQRKDGIVLFIVIDGRQPGYSIGTDMGELIDILTNYGAYNAVNLDGGASSTLTVNGKLYNKPCGIKADGSFGERALPNAWIVK